MAWPFHLLTKRFGSVTIVKRAGSTRAVTSLQVSGQEVVAL